MGLAHSFVCSIRKYYVRYPVDFFLLVWIFIGNWQFVFNQTLQENRKKRNKFALLSVIYHVICEWKKKFQIETNSRTPPIERILIYYYHWFYFCVGFDSFGFLFYFCCNNDQHQQDWDPSIDDNTICNDHHHRC